MHSAALAVNFTDCVQHGLCLSCVPPQLQQQLNDAFGVVCAYFVLLWVGLGMRAELLALPAPAMLLMAFPRGDCSPAPQPRHGLVRDASVDVELLRAGPENPSTWPESLLVTEPSLHWWKSQAPPPSPGCSSPKQLNLSPSSQFPIHSGAAVHSLPSQPGDYARARRELAGSGAGGAGQRALRQGSPARLSPGGSCCQPEARMSPRQEAAALAPSESPRSCRAMPRPRDAPRSGRL